MSDETVHETIHDTLVTGLQAIVTEGPAAGRSAQASQSLSIGSAPSNDLVVQDERVSRFHLELERAGARIRVKDLSSTNGTFIGDVRIDNAAVLAGTKLHIGRSVIQVGDGSSYRTEVFSGDRISGVIGRSEVMRQLLARVEKTAASDASVLLTGESGTGKEVIARAIHENSPRVDGPFEVVDCGAMQPTLIGSELFGHERGAFTGADSQHLGAFERANGGTIFLDEIGELPPSLQTALLGALERRSFRRLGGKSQISFDARVISATHRDLRSDVNAGGFRLDLFFRVAVVTLKVPALRERRDDIPLLVEHFMHRLGSRIPVATAFPPRVMETLVNHRWAGNVRELRNAVEAAMVLGEPQLFEPVEAAELEGGDATDALRLHHLLALPLSEARAQVIEDFEAVYLKSLLERSGGRVLEAAARAGVDRSYLSRVLKKRGIKVKKVAGED